MNNLEKTPPLPYPLSRKTRLSIMFTLMGLFFLITPALILSARGFNFDFSSKTFIHGGALSIESNPNATTLFLNAIKVRSQAPFRTSHLLPGNYQVRLERPGYYVWEMPFSIVSNQTTYVHGIDLFRIQKPILTLQNEKNTGLLSFSEKNDSLVFTQKRENIFEVISLDPKKFEQNLLTRVISESNPVVEWSPNQDALSVQYIFENNTNLLLFNPTNSTRIQTLTVASSSLPQIQWSGPGMETALFLQNKNKNKIQKMNLNTTVDFHTLSTSSVVWFVDQKEAVWEFVDNSLQKFEGGKKSLSIEVPFAVSKILDVNEDRIIAISQKDVIVLHLNNNTLTSREVFPFGGYKLNKTTQSYFVWFQGELRSISKDGSIQFINRFSQDIQTVDALTSNTILIGLQDKLIAFHPTFFHTQELVNADAIEHVYVSEKRREIYFLGVIQGKHGVWSVGF